MFLNLAGGSNELNQNLPTERTTSTQKTMKGRPRKTRIREPKKTAPKTVTSEAVSSAAAEESNAEPGSEFAILSQSPACFLPSTPKRGRRQTRQKQGDRRTSTPEHSLSTDHMSSIPTSPPGAKQTVLKYTELISQIKTSEVESSCCQSKSQGTRRGRKRVAKEMLEACSKTTNPPAKSRRGRVQKEKGNSQKEASQSSMRTRSKFELTEQDDSLLSSDLSIELSHHEELLPILSFQEDEESADEDDDELPSFQMQMDKKPPSITEGVFVWYKYRSYPFWPALVKKVNRKLKKASIIFIDDPMIHKKKGFTVALKILKPFDCEEANELMCNAKEQYDAAIEWSLELITDYRIRIACGSFSGSFIEYFAHDMSYPVRRKYPQAASERLTITSDTMMEDLCDDHKEDSFNEEQEAVSRGSKRLLPDRTHAAHNRANEKLVHFIVKQRMVEGRLLAVIRGQQQSRWLRSFLSANRRRVVNIYLEDDQQLDQVYWYLNELYTTATATASCLAEVKSMERVPFVLDVLLPEAIIYAIAGVDKVSVKKAEEKYLRGRCISNRERQEFDLMIERQIRKKS
uniref:PWWP domain-containing protein n=2 Tax=Anabas testudineus TaxID=64144 RepID=A0A3Q1JE50_ANATE